MFDSETIKSFGQWPLLQFAGIILTMIAGIYAMRRGEKDAKKPPELFPQWLMMGPLHDMMQSVHEVAEQGRRSNDLLREIKDIASDQLRQSEINRGTLETIRNESRLR